jgi:hypothetical protein
MGFDNNRSRDVAGPILKRPYDVELQMANKTMGEDTQTIEQFSLSDLHDGNIEKPVAATGMQHVKVDMAMGKDMAGNEPKLAQGMKSGESKSDKGEPQSDSEAQKGGKKAKY